MTGKKFYFLSNVILLVKGTHSQYIRISNGEKLSTCHFNQAVKHLLKKLF